MSITPTNDEILKARSGSGTVGGAWWGTVVLFLVHGLVVSTWVSRIPDIQAGLRLTNGVLGLTLLSSALGAVTIIPFIGIAVSRFGSKPVVIASTGMFCMLLPLLALAQDALSLAILLLLYGAAAAAMDVSMNAQGVEVEKALGKPTMSRFHGMFSLGGMAGAAIGGLVAAHAIHALPHFMVSAALNLALSTAVASLLLNVHESRVEKEHRLPLRNIPPVLLALSVIGFCILLSEGAMADWTGVFLKQSLHAGAGTAAQGYAVFSACMAVFRFVGDWITTRLGPFRTVCAGSLVAACGLLWALSTRSPQWALPGFGLTGAGFSVIIPLVFGSGGRVKSISPGAGIATVTSIGYTGFIIGPPAIGFLSQLVTLRLALGLVVACCLISAILARYMRSLQGEVQQECAAEITL